MNGPNKALRAVVLGLGYFFLYVPIISLMVFSFNESPAVTSWTCLLYTSPSPRD